MAEARSFQRQAGPAGFALALGLAAGWWSAGSTTTALAAALVSAAVVLVLAWRRHARWRESLAALTEYIVAWRTRLESVGAPAESVPELDDLRAELGATQRAIQEFRTRRTQQLTGLERDTLLLRSVLGTMVEAVAVVDSEARLLYRNPAARRLLELGERDVTGRLLHELVRAPRLLAVVDDVLRTGVEQSLEAELTRENRTVMISCGPLPLEPAPGAVLVLHDVSDLRRLERLRREFASNVSHELKTPLTSIQAYADVLLDGALDDPANNRSFVERILQQTERLSRLIQDLLSLSRIESQSETAELEQLSLDELLEEVLPDHQSVAEARGLALHCELDGTAPAAITAEGEGLRTILNNLIRNALSYTPRGGHVTVRVGRRGAQVQLEVQDDGVGIAREHHERIFDRFYRVDKARSRDVGGTGLGLSIVKHLVEQSGGTIELESEVGRGSLFRVRWPAEEGDAKPQASAET